MTDIEAYAGRLRDDGLAIFLFHGVVEGAAYEVRNYTRKHLAKDPFARLLAALKDRGTPVSMDAVVDRRRDGRPLPKRAFAVTFDDGFENNLTVAAPVLADLGVPATFYVTTDFVQRNRMSWIDRIEWALERTPKGRLRLPWGERTFATAAERIRLLQEVRSVVKQDPAIDADDLATDVQRQSGLPETWSSDEPVDKKLTWSEVRALSLHPYFTIGGHSHGHANLDFLGDGALEREIALSLDLLKEHAGVGPRHYSYPEGSRQSYSERVIERLKAHGVECCPTAEDGINDAATDLFRLKRIAVA
jgi:peptidoglycan/xylan/chitin deacetylase (PgdA/CDA1 family)